MNANPPDIPEPVPAGGEFAFPPKPTAEESMDVEEDILTDEETDADSDNAAEHTDAIHPDMVWKRELLHG